MRISLSFYLLLSLAVLSSYGTRCHAGEVVTQVTTVREVSPFDRGGWEAGLTAGFLYSPVFATGHRTKFTYLQQDLTLGYMLSTPGEPGVFRGNFEVLLNFAGGEVLEGPGSYLLGGRLLFRYNFVQPEARWVPFIQIGGGGIGSDASHDLNQRILGSAFSFTLVGDIGVRYFVTPRWAVLVMLDYEHISNANRAERNLGVNAVGGMVGLSTFF